MEPLSDEELDQLLLEWRAPLAPAEMPRAAVNFSWRWLWRGSLRLPVPLALALLAVIVSLALLAFRPHAPDPQQARSKFSDFRTHQTGSDPRRPERRL